MFENVVVHPGIISRIFSNSLSLAASTTSSSTSKSSTDIDMIDVDLNYAPATKLTCPGDDAECGSVNGDFGTTTRWNTFYYKRETYGQTGFEVTIKKEWYHSFGFWLRAATPWTLKKGNFGIKFLWRSKWKNFGRNIFRYKIHVYYRYVGNTGAGQ
jgi:hypothetical protein